jgi:hypothetical protein
MFRPSQEDLVNLAQLKRKRLNEYFHNILKCIQHSQDDGFRDEALNSARHFGEEMSLTQKDCDQINMNLGIGYWMYPNGKWSY